MPNPTRIPFYHPNFQYENIDLCKYDPHPRPDPYTFPPQPHPASSGSICTEFSASRLSRPNIGCPAQKNCVTGKHSNCRSMNWLAVFSGHKHVAATPCIQHLSGPLSLSSGPSFYVKTSSTVVLCNPCIKQELEYRWTPSHAPTLLALLPRSFNSVTNRCNMVKFYINPVKKKLDESLSSGLFQLQCRDSVGKNAY